MGYSAPIDLEGNERGQLDGERRGMIFKLSRETKIPLPGDVELMPGRESASIHINEEYNHPVLIYYPRRALLGKRHNSVVAYASHGRRMHETNTSDISNSSEDLTPDLTRKSRCEGTHRDRRNVRSGLGQSMNKADRMVARATMGASSNIFHRRCGLSEIICRYSNSTANNLYRGMCVIAFKRFSYDYTLTIFHCATSQHRL